MKNPFSAGEGRPLVFMPDATRAAVRGLRAADLLAVGTRAVVVNTYHLMLRPGTELIAAAGGVKKFMNFPGAVASDSGGYQVYSLIRKNPRLGRITERGAEFRDVYNGSRRLLTPEESVRLQADLGVDLMVVLDDPSLNDSSDAELEASVRRTVAWAERSWAEYRRQYELRGWDEETAPKLVAVIQGGPRIDLRRQCARALKSLGDFDGYGFGGRHIDAQGRRMDDVLSAVAEEIPPGKLKFALGIGTPADIVACRDMGWELFDCVIPTREGRHGRVFSHLRDDFTYRQTNLTAAAAAGEEAIEEGCDCGCAGYSRAYLRHLFTVGDPLAGTICAGHNLRFFNRLCERLAARERGSGRGIMKKSK